MTRRVALRLAVWAGLLAFSLVAWALAIWLMWVLVVETWT